MAVSDNNKGCSAAKYSDTDAGKSNHKNPDNACIRNQVAFGAYKEHELQNYVEFILHFCLLNIYEDVTFGFSAIYSNAAFNINH